MGRLENNGSWQELIEAADRKVRIAGYHADRLREVARGHTASSESAPPISVQAHFEGVVVSIMAAVDQIAQAVNSAWQLQLNSSNLVREAFTALAKHLPEIGDWFREPIGRDLRRMRVRMIHYAYSKMSSPEGPRWSVESAETEFSGSRELVDYANGTVEYGNRLCGLLPRIKQQIASYARSMAAGEKP